MVPRIEKKAIGVGAAYIYIETIASIISGYVFWILMSKIATAETIGISSTVVSFASIATVIASVGIPTGVQRFIGKNFSQDNLNDVKTIVITSLLLIGIVIFICGSLILIFQDLLFQVFSFDFGLSLISISIIASSIISMLFRSVVISTFKTKSLPLIIISSSFFKIFVAVILVLLGAGAIGITLGFALNHILSSILLGIVVRTKVLKSASIDYSSFDFIQISKNLLVSSMVYWIPLVITTIGSQLGTIVVFGSQGSNQAGVYFLALIIVTGLTSVMNSLFSIALPALSSLRDHRKRFAWQTIRLSAIFLVPFSCSLLFYSKELLQSLGNDYANGSLSLQILLLSMLPMAVTNGVSTLAYSYGNYRHVLLIGLAMSVPSTGLYFTLVPIYGGLGAAVGYTLGTLIGCIVSIILAKKIGMLIFWKDLTLLFIIPTIIAFTLSYFQINFVLGTLGTIVFSYLTLLKIHVVTRSDVQNSLNLLPQDLSSKILRVVDKFRS
jgi:O-antigen/teichoic acid export membrane protein